MPCRSRPQRAIRASVVAILAGLFALTAFSPAEAQVRRPPAGGLTVFADSNFRGRSVTLREDAPSLAAVKLNDAISSVRVTPGEYWELCEHENYAGRCALVIGDASNLGRGSWNDTFSSARRLASIGDAPIAAAPPPSGLELFSSVRFAGDRRLITGPESDLRRLNFNDAARSLQVPDGQTWEVCADIEFANCVVVSTGWDDLAAAGMAGQISSVRPWRGPDAGNRFNRRGDEAYLVFYENREFRGRTYRVDTDMPQASGLARAASVEVAGGSWQMCERASFAGRCVVVSDNLPDLAAVGLRNGVGSLRQVQR